jgi:hypothetical protein
MMFALGYYLGVGTGWAVYCLCRPKAELTDYHPKWYHYLLGFIVNTVLWPMAVAVSMDDR